MIGESPHDVDSRRASVRHHLVRSTLMPHFVRRAVTLVVAGAVALLVSHSRPAGQDKFQFRTGVELVNVTATVSDRAGRFVSGLTQSDFVVYEDDRPVDITHFSAERVPVSLGIVLDTSGSMRGQKIAAARAALNRFLFDLLGPEDEFFLYTLRQYTPLGGGLDDRSQPHQLSAATYAAGRRHSAVRRGRGGAAAPAIRATP